MLLCPQRVAPVRREFSGAWPSQEEGVLPTNHHPCLFPRRGTRVFPCEQGQCQWVWEWDQSREEKSAKAHVEWLVLSCFPPLRIEETWRLWQKFLDDYSRFEDWLKSAERTAAYPNSSEVLYTSAKEELKKFEVKTLPAQCSW